MPKHNLLGRAVGIVAIFAVLVSIALNFELGWLELSILVLMAASAIVVTLRLL